MWCYLQTMSESSPVLVYSLLSPVLYLQLPVSEPEPQSYAGDLSTANANGFGFSLGSLDGAVAWLAVSHPPEVESQAEQSYGLALPCETLSWQAQESGVALQWQRENLPTIDGLGAHLQLVLDRSELTGGDRRVKLLLMREATTKSPIESVSTSSVRN